MFYAFIISAVLLFAGVLLLGIRIFFVKGGQFPNIHIGGSKELKNKGIACATTQDRDARNRVKPLNITELIDQITE
ncbi:MAG TPA: hypothetical protein P5084_06720 [Paludibacter sp.]|nr:hypothetical protein [Paludibacter sp.]